MFDFFAEKGFRKYLKEARRILDVNWTGRYTKPSPSLYPHQWNWDSGFIAIGYAHYHQRRAMQELRSLFEHQWENGMVPQIAFNPDSLGHYFPEPDFWQVPDGRLTSGITMPPLHATAALHIWEHASDRKLAKEFLDEMFQHLMALHRYFYHYRDPERTGLVYIRHPWESGLDNSPNWDGPLRNIEVDPRQLPPYERKDLEHGIPAEQRPTDADYDRYVYLVDLFRRHQYDEERIYGDCPFLVQDVLFNSILCRAGRDLVEIGTIIGKDTGEAEEWLEQTSSAIRERLWSPERAQFDPIDLVTGHQLETATAASFMPLYSFSATQEQADILYERLNSVSFCALHQGNCFTIPNFDMQQEGFDSRNYWRGPVWININWMLSQGLQHYGFRQKSDSMKKDIIQLPVRFGFHEYFDSITGRGYGSSGFSWTAALFIDLIHDYFDADKHRMNWAGWTEKEKLRDPVFLNEVPGLEPGQIDLLPTRLMTAMGDLRSTFFDAHRGIVDYRSLKDSPEYHAYLELSARLRTFDLNTLSREAERLAFWINLYNTLVIHAIIELDITSSVREIPNFFQAVHYRIGHLAFSLDDIEHGILRSNARHPHRLTRQFGKNDPRRVFMQDHVDPRVHFALTCGSRSCAPINYYDPGELEEQLEEAAHQFVDSSEVVILPEKNTVLLSPIFKWYVRDFGSRKNILEFIQRHLHTGEEADYLAAHIDTIKIEYLSYDWNLNRAL